jgi:hypothetical protein
MEAGRHHANSNEKYRTYFKLPHSKIAKYNVLPKNTYNIDKKGFAVRVTRKTKRIYNKALYH